MVSLVPPASAYAAAVATAERSDDPPGSRLVLGHIEKLLEHMSDDTVAEPARFASFVELIQLSIAWGAFDYVSNSARVFYPDPQLSGEASLGRWLGDTIFTRTPKEYQDELKTAGTWKDRVALGSLMQLAEVGVQLLAENGGLKPHQVIDWFGTFSPGEYRRIWARRILSQSPDLATLLAQLVRGHPVLEPQFQYWCSKPLLPS